MQPKVLIVLGSPRKNGNSAALAAQVADGARLVGAEVEAIYLNEMNLKPCQACGGCQKNTAPQCVIPDDMNALYPKLQAAGGIVIASPIYFFNISAQTKIFIDRCFAVGTKQKNIFAGKKFALILTYADPDPYLSGAVNALRSFQDMCGYFNADIGGIIYGQAGGKGEIAGNKALLEKAFSVGKQLVAL